MILNFPIGTEEKVSVMIRNVKCLYRRMCGSTMKNNLKSYYAGIDEIKEHALGMAGKSDHQLQMLSQDIITQARHGRALNELMPEAYALVGEAIKRILALSPFDPQYMGAIAMHQGKIAEMQTGEGKTLAAVFPAYLNALPGNGVHILTFNDYLACRDAEWMGPIYEFLGLSVGYVGEKMAARKRKLAYLSDITYLTANEAGFDYLRDSLSYHPEDRVHRGLNFAIVDEADSIMIDNARIPMVIATNFDDIIRDTLPLAHIAKRLKKDTDIQFDDNSGNFCLTERGTKRVESLLDRGDLYDPENIDLLTKINCAIHAEFLFHRDVDYIVRHDKIEMIDEFTGRVADKRRWPDGLQGAIEAKENIRVQSKGKILNSTTLQQFLGKYARVSGMTATACTAREEFKRFYNLEIVVVPPNKPCIREDYPDKVFANKEAKYRAVSEEIITIHGTGRPILVGTGSVQESERLSKDLQKMGIDGLVLNAKNDADEAKIIAEAGRFNAVTISTNMAGRGIDIRLGGVDEREKKQVIDLGGLYVIGLNRHDSKRIDNQLRGRAGRQGDPGASRFFISMTDDIFQKYHLSALLPGRIIESKPRGDIENRIVNREIDRIQRIIEGQHLEIKKTLSRYNLLVEQQREIILKRRERILGDDSFLDFFESNCPDQYNLLLTRFRREKIVAIGRFLLLYFIDRTWSQYLDEMADIREGVHLLRLGRQDPLLEFNKRIIRLFERLQDVMESEVVVAFNAIDISSGDLDMENMGFKTPSSTWTYLVNDDPFKNMPGLGISTMPAVSMEAFLLLLIFPLLKRLRRRKKVSTDIFQ